MTPDQVETAAWSDPDARPLTPADLGRMRRTPQAKIIRRALALTQEEFAARYHIPLGTLRDWEQGRTEPDHPARAYLIAIARDPEGVRQAFASGRRESSTARTSDVSNNRKGLLHTYEGESFTHRQLWRVARRQFDHAAANPTGAFLDHLAAMTFAFHTLEAYLNFIGERLAPDIWSDEGNFFRSEPYRGFDGKMRKILELLGIQEPDRSTRPYSTVWLLKELRDVIGHGKTEKFSRTVQHTGLPNDEVKLGHTPFGGLITAENARRAMEDVEELVEQIHSAAGSVALHDVWFGDKALDGPLQHSSGRTTIAT